MSIHSEKLQTLLQEIYDSYGFSGAVGITHYMKFSDRIRNFNIIEVIALLVKQFSFDYVFDFLLSTPYLWSELSDLQWLEIISFVNPRPDPLQVPDHHTHFADIHFLCKFLQVDALNFFLENQGYSDSDKVNVLRYCRRQAHIFFMDDLDIEDMDGDYYLEYSQLSEIKHRLLSNGTFREFKYTEDELVEYLENLLEKFD
jgi:hypothetical protein